MRELKAKARTFTEPHETTQTRLTCMRARRRLGRRLRSPPAVAAAASVCRSASACSLLSISPHLWLGTQLGGLRRLGLTAGAPPLPLSLPCSPGRRRGRRRPRRRHRRRRPCRRRRRRRAAVAPPSRRRRNRPTKLSKGPRREAARAIAGIMGDRGGAPKRRYWSRRGSATTCTSPLVV